MEFLLGLLPNVVADFAGRNMEWIIGLVGIPSLGALLKSLLNKFGAEDKFTEGSRRRVAAYNNWWNTKLMPKAAIGEPQGKWLTQKMTGKFGSLWNSVGE